MAVFVIKTERMVGIFSTRLTVSLINILMISNTLSNLEQLKQAHIN